jgi:hypothetical protein
MLKAVVGHSNDVWAKPAVQEVIAQVKEGMEGHVPQAGVLVAGIEFHHQEALEAIVEAFPGIQLVGCTTDGELSSAMGFEEDSMALLALYSDTFHFCAGVATELSVRGAESIPQAMREVCRDCPEEPAFVLVFPDSMTVSTTDVLSSVLDELGERFPVFGGTAGDQWRFEQTFQFFGGDVYSDAMPFLFVTGAIAFSQGVGSGWSPQGRQARVTRVDKNVLYEIDGQSALSYYRHYLGEYLLPPGETPLAIFEADAHEYYLRAPLIYDEENGSIVFAADIPPDSIVQLATTHREQILETAALSVERAKAAYGEGTPELAIVISCAARKQLLGTRTDEEFALFQQVIGDVPLFGFYSYGEIGAFGREQRPCFHNETVVTLLLGDGDKQMGS